MSELPQVGDVLFIDSLAANCGYFTVTHEVNNGYGCAHPRQEERRDGHGCCYSWSCPIARELDRYDPNDRELAGFEGEADAPGDGMGDGWMVLVRPVRKRHVHSSAWQAAQTRRARRSA